ncbi:Retrovirus-related Pol polyprotein from transposon TNT 1-94 [Capsicum chinense]|nr:Retrovirus-related Pol polyprotein from transposon TNT 1-94 [Capsicum chinense]
MDVKIVFLHGELKEEIYMDQPEGFKQGYKKTSSDHCVFVQSFLDDDFIILLLYVDDMLIVDKNASRIDELKKQLCKSFAMKNLGHAKQILATRITHLKDEIKIYLSQEKYIELVLERFNMNNAKVVNTPLAGHMKLSRKMCPTMKEEKESITKVPYSSIIGILMYTMVCTRPDIAHAVGVVSRFLENPGKEHWKIVKWILRYLRGTSGDCLCFGRIVMAAALINDIFAWILLAFTIAFLKNKNMALASVWILLSSVAFVIFCVIIIRPLVGWMIKRTPECESISELLSLAWSFLTARLAWSFLNTRGLCFGAFVDFFFSISGLKTEISAIDEVGTWALLVLVIVLACAGKIAGTVLVILYYIILIHEGVILGILMNAKGLIEMIVINIGKHKKNEGTSRDQREALSYGLRMREHPGINLTVIKLLLGEAALEDRRSDSRKSSMNNDSSVLTVVTDDDKEKQLDEDYISDFSARTANDDSVLYIERVVNHGEETIAAIRTIDHAHDLFIVGRGQGMISPLTTGLIDWSECPRARCKRRSIGILESCISCFGVSCATICRNGTRGSSSHTR